MNYKEQIKRLQDIYPDAREVECQWKPQQEPNNCFANSIDYSKAYGWELVGGWSADVINGKIPCMIAHIWNKNRKKHRDTTIFYDRYTKERLSEPSIYIYSPSVSKWLNQLREDYNNGKATAGNLHTGYDWNDTQGWIRSTEVRACDKLFQNTYEFDSRLTTTLAYS